MKRRRRKRATQTQPLRLSAWASRPLRAVCVCPPRACRRCPPALPPATCWAMRSAMPHTCPSAPRRPAPPPSTRNRRRPPWPRRSGGDAGSAEAEARPLRRPPATAAPTRDEPARANKAKARARGAQSECRLHALEGSVDAGPAESVQQQQRGALATDGGWHDGPRVSRRSVSSSCELNGKDGVSGVLWQAGGVDRRRHRRRAASERQRAERRSRPVVLHSAGLPVESTGPDATAARALKAESNRQLLAEMTSKRQRLAE